LVEGKSLSDYSMFWQVDGGGLVQMNDSQVDFPHKESDVDVGPWNWNGNGPYNLNFVAKDNSGNVIAQKKSTINVAH
jgi:anti-sigma factor ChrR (cupin superfamily)